MSRIQIRFVLVLLVMVQPFGAQASTPQEKLDAWQGEWGQWENWTYPDVKHSSGHSLKISECYVGRSETKHFNCSIRMVSQKDAVKCNAWSQIAIDSDDRLSFRYNECAISLKRIGGAQPSIEASYEGKCDPTCKPIFAKSFRYKSSKPFFSGQAHVELDDAYRAQCYSSDSKAVREWCTNHQIKQLDFNDNQSFEGRHQDCFNAPNYVQCKSDLEKRSKESYYAWRKSMWSTCESASNTSDCMIQQYKAKIPAIDVGPLGDEKEAARVADQIDGVYKTTWKLALVTGEKYDAEDVLELVKIDKQPTSLYFKTKLNFDNGHSCFLFGVAQFRKTGFVYQSNSDDDKCVLHIKVEKDSIGFEDIDGKCRENWCGARGAFDNVKFPSSKKRKIRYMELLKNSEDYKTSLAGLNR